jgi:hypothetical protein
LEEEFMIENDQNIKMFIFKMKEANVELKEKQG